MPGKSTTLNWMFSLLLTRVDSIVMVGVRKKVSWGDIFEKTTLDMEVLPDLEIGLSHKILLTSAYPSNKCSLSFMI